MIDQYPPEQELAVNDVSMIARKRGVDEPPEVLLICDVTHEETMQPWRTQLRFSRRQIQNVIHMLKFMAEKEGLQW